MRLLVVAIAMGGVVGCGDSAVSPDAPVQEATLEATDDGGNLVSTVELGETLVGQASSHVVRLRNTGPARTGAIAISIGGDHANDFTLDNLATTCAGQVLGPGATCEIGIVFRPLAAGVRTAVLTYTSSPGGTGTISLSGPAVMPDLRFSPASASLGPIEAGSSLGAVFELRNEGPATATLDDVEVTGQGFTRASTTCGPTLAPSTSCDIAVTVAPAALDLVAGMLQVTSGTDVFSAPISATGVRKVTVVKAGHGAGTVTSSPAGIDCGTRCDALFSTDVMLTATAGANTSFTGWSLAACGDDATCTVPAGLDPTSVTATFALTGGATLDISFLGDGMGEVRVRDSSALVVTCYASCSVPVMPGTQVSIEPATISGFGGFTGCTSSGGTCSLTVPVGASPVTATFTKDARERWTRLLPERVVAAAYDTSGDLIVGTAARLSKLDGATGSTIWTRPFSVQSIDAGPNAAIYVLGSSGAESGLFQLDGTGATVWFRTLPPEVGAGAPPGMSFPRRVAAHADGAVAVQGSSGIARWDAAGTLSWARTGPSGMRHGIGIEPSGVVVVAYDNLSEEIEGARFAALDGAPLTGLGVIGHQYHGGLDLDANGRLVTSYSGHSSTHLVTGPHGTSDSFAAGAAYAESGVSSSLTGDVLWAISEHAAWRARRLSSTLAPEWTLTRGRTVDDFGTGLSNLSASAGGHLALVGEYVGFASGSLGMTQLGWVQVFEP